jgi:ABC-2 type transport system permease protein
MNLFDELEGIYYIFLKDLKAYYFKPPNISWGILFPIVLALAFTLRSPNMLQDLAPGLIAMAALFGTTSMEAIVITFEKRVGALERLFLAPISIWSIILGKIFGGSFFGLVISGVMTVIALFFLGASVLHPLSFIIVMALTVLVHSALGALVAVSVREVFEAQTLSNYFRFPMIFLCGVFIPIESMPLYLQVIGRLLPLTYSVEALRMIMGIVTPTWLLVDIVVLFTFLLIFIFLSKRLLQKNMG